MTDDATLAGDGWPARAPLALTAGLTVLAVEAVSLTVTRVYGLNVSVTGPTVTTLLVAGLVTAWSLPVARTAPRRLWFGALAVLLGGVAAAATGGFLGALGGVAVATAATPPLVALVAALRDRAAVGVAGGLLVVVGLRLWLRTAPPWATLAGSLALSTLALWTVGLALVLDRRDALPTLDGPLDVAAGPLWATLVAAATVLAVPGFLIRWSPRPRVATAALAVAGLVAGVVLVVWRGGATRRGAVGAGAAYVLGCGGLLALEGPPAAVAVGLATFGAVGLLAVGCRRRHPRSRRRVAAGLAAAQVAVVGAAFLFVVAANWAFFPAALGEPLRGTATELLLATLLVLPVTAAAGRRERPPTASEDRDRPDPDRRGALAAVAAGALGLAGLARPAVPVDADDDGTLTVTTYNVHQFLDGRGEDWNLTAVRSVLAESDADVVGLQESEGGRLTSGGVDGVGWLAAELGYWPCRGPPTGALTYGVALLSRYPIRDSRVVYPPVHRSPPRPFLVATVAAPDGDVPVVVAHLQTKQAVLGERRSERAVAAQVAQADAVVDAAADPRAVVLGDFNSRPGDAAYERLADSLTDAWAGARPDADGDTYAAGDPTKRIDHVFVGSAWNPTDAAVSVGPAASDHRALTVDLTRRE